MRYLIFSICSAITLSFAGCGLNQIKDRKKAMESMLVTNASLSAIESTLGSRFDIYRRGSAEWIRLVTNHNAYSSIPTYCSQAWKVRGGWSRLNDFDADLDLFG